MNDIHTSPRNRLFLKNFENSIVDFFHMHFYMTLKGQLRTANLFDINNSEDIRTVIVDPALKIYRSIGII